MTGDWRPETGKNDRELTRAVQAGMLRKRETENALGVIRMASPLWGLSNLGIKKRNALGVIRMASPLWGLSNLGYEIASLRSQRH